MDRRLQCLGHLGSMSEERLLKKILFGELMKERAYHGTKMRWRDRMSRDRADNWFEG